jgi:hypothetical protein
MMSNSERQPPSSTRPFNSRIEALQVKSGGTRSFLQNSKSASDVLANEELLFRQPRCLKVKREFLDDRGLEPRLVNIMTMFAL